MNLLFVRILIFITGILILLFVTYRFVRWHKFYYEIRKFKVTPYYLNGKIKRNMYLKPMKYATYGRVLIEPPIKINDYSDGNYYIKA